jgi:tetratricopeptide (TPR) repeat protein
MDSRTVVLVAICGVAHSALAAEPLLGPGVGNADTLVSEGSKLFNRKQYAKATELFLKASRASPSTLTTYLQLARAHMLAKQLQRGCYAYRVFLKASPDTPDRKKAVAESDQCERQLKSAKGQPDDLTPQYVETKALFFSALDQQLLLGSTGAAGALRSLVSSGVLGPDLADMGAKLGAAAVAQADAIHQRALRLEVLAPDFLRAARPLYEVASDVGTSPPDAKERMAFLDGLAELADKAYTKAEQLFTEATKGDPKNKEYLFYRGLALFQSGDRAGALKLWEVQLRDDPRTAVARVAVAADQSAESGAVEVEKLLFGTRFRP